MDGITSDIIKLGGLIVLTYLTKIFNNILKTKQIPDSWHELKELWTKTNQENKQVSEKAVLQQTICKL